MFPITLYYWDLPARGETARLILTIGKLDFVDKRVKRGSPEWAELKPQTPFGQVPVLEVDGKMLAQTSAIDRYCATITGMLPSDPWKLAWAEQGYFFMEDLWQTTRSAWTTQMSADATEEQKADAWKALVAPDSEFNKKMGMLENFIAKRDGKFLAGDQLSHADLAIFVTLAMMASGWMPGMPRDILSGYPALKAFRHSIASLPAVAAFYAKEEDEVRQAGFKPDGEGATGTA